MSKYTCKEIKDIINTTPADEKGLTYDQYAQSVPVGFFTPAGCNWAYNVRVVQLASGRLAERAFMFGEVVTRREA